MSGEGGRGLSSAAVTLRDPTTHKVKPVITEISAPTAASGDIRPLDGVVILEVGNVQAPICGGSILGSDALLVQLISLSAYQPGLKQIDFAAAVHLPSGEFEAGDLPPRSVRWTKAK